MAENSKLMSKFQALGMSEQKAKETIKNVNVTKNLQLALAEAKDASLDEGVGMLLYHMVTKLKPQVNDHLPLLVSYIVEKKLDSTMRIDTALEYLLKSVQQKGVSIDLKNFELECGVGVVVTPEEIDRCVEEQMKLNKEALLEQRYHFNAFKIMQEVRAKLRWADAKAVKAEIDVQMFDLLGPKTEEDLKPLVKGDKKKDKPAPAAKTGLYKLKLNNAFYVN